MPLVLAGRYPEPAIHAAGITPHPVPLPMGEGTPSQPLRPAPLSHGERAGVRGVTYAYGTSSGQWRVLPRCDDEQARKWQYNRAIRQRRVSLRQFLLVSREEGRLLLGG